MIHGRRNVLATFVTGAALVGTSPAQGSEPTWPEWLRSVTSAPSVADARWQPESVTPAAVTTVPQERVAGVPAPPMRALSAQAATTPVLAEVVPEVPEPKRRPLLPTIVRTSGSLPQVNGPPILCALPTAPPATTAPQAVTIPVATVSAPPARTVPGAPVTEPTVPLPVAMTPASAVVAVPVATVPPASESDSFGEGHVAALDPSGWVAVLATSTVDRHRLEAIVSLAGVPDWHRTPGAVGAVVGVLTTDYQTQVRLTALRMLAAAPWPPRTRTSLLAASAATDGSPQVRDEAQRLLQTMTQVSAKDR